MAGSCVGNHFPWNGGDSWVISELSKVCTRIVFRILGLFHMFQWSTYFHNWFDLFSLQLQIFPSVVYYDSWTLSVRISANEKPVSCIKPTGVITTGLCDSFRVMTERNVGTGPQNTGVFQAYTNTTYCTCNLPMWWWLCILHSISGSCIKQSLTILWHFITSSDNTYSLS